MNNNSKNIKLVVLTFVMLALPMFISTTMASVGPVGPPPVPPGVPIDGGITLLLAGLGAYGAKKLFTKEEN